MGLAWAPSADGKTVVRAGAGLYYGLTNLLALDAERAALGPPGVGRQSFSGTSILNPLPGIPGVPVGRALNFPGTPTLFTGAELMAILPAIEAGKSQSLTNADPAVQAIQITKQFAGASNNGLVPSDFPDTSALHSSVGVQRRIAGDLVVSADFAYRHFIHTNQMGAVGLDLNHYSSARGPVIPKCTAVQQNDPNAQCSNGPINVIEDQGTAAYKGLLLARRGSAFRTGSSSWPPTPIPGAKREPVFAPAALQSRQLASKHRSDRFLVTLRKSSIWPLLARLPWQFELGT